MSELTLTRQEAEDFLYHEARLLDEGRYDEWLELMTPDVTYWVPNGGERTNPTEHVSIIRDDHALLGDRVWRITTSGRNHTQDPPSQFVRCVSNVIVEPADVADEAVVLYNLLLTEFRSGVQRQNVSSPTWRTARCRYRLRRVDGRWRIAYRQVVLLDNAGTLPAMTYVI